ncbi:MAG: phosphoesterase [Treponema sp. GWB1_62_6]|nr:MAG: phosphoesterase [Treponema sp. GWC1_61_84]OHE67486.1 MAG: phosphoesterase [Treponema sp. GWB1_62_6]OHE75992.1 MAG: phosphoesterase [Treponema sp. RIFOXYC1_FULL_61_9]HCM29116.1 DHH family phosphoesterase [Treponema sp.]
MLRTGAFADLIEALNASCALSSSCSGEDARRVVVQPHDFPDHDAAAAAFGLARLLDVAGFRARILYRGRLRSHSLLAMIAELDISMERIRGPVPADLEDAPCVIVDGSPAYANAKPLTERLVGVVDHHPNPGILGCPFVDVRTSYGSCSTIIADYWLEHGSAVDRDTATALLMGIQMDTDFLSRRVSPADLDAHHHLFFRADWEFGTRVVKASLSLKDLPAFEAAAANSRTKGCLFFTLIPLECTQELVSIIADFFLRLKEISVTAIVETGSDRFHVSVRSRSGDLSAAAVVKLALSGIGEGGGHDHMAGGVIEAKICPREDALFARFVEAVESAQETQ